MIIRDFIDLVNKEKRKRERAEAAKKFAVGMGTLAAAGIATGIVFYSKLGKETREDMKNKVEKTIENIKDAAHKKVEAAKDSAAHKAQDVRNAIDDVNETTDDVKKHIKDGHNRITQDIHKTVDNISDDLNKAVK